MWWAFHLFCYLKKRMKATAQMQMERLVGFEFECRLTLLVVKLQEKKGKVNRNVLIVDNYGQ